MEGALLDALRLVNRRVLSQSKQQLTLQDDDAATTALLTDGTSTSDALITDSGTAMNSNKQQQREGNDLNSRALIALNADDTSDPDEPTESVAYQALIQSPRFMHVQRLRYATTLSGQPDQTFRNVRVPSASARTRGLSGGHASAGTPGGHHSRHHHRSHSAHKPHGSAPGRSHDELDDDDDMRTDTYSDTSTGGDGQYRPVAEVITLSLDRNTIKRISQLTINRHVGRTKNASKPKKRPFKQRIEVKKTDSDDD